MDFTLRHGSVQPQNCKCGRPRRLRWRNRSQQLRPWEVEEEDSFGGRQAADDCLLSVAVVERTGRYCHYCLLLEDDGGGDWRYYLLLLTAESGMELATASLLVS